MGRFTQVDPFDGALAVPASMNGYGYAHGSPMMYTDPSGQVVLLTAILIGAAIGGAMGFGFAYGTGLYDNWSYVEQEGFWAAQKRLDWGRIWASTAIGAVSGALGGAAGWAGWGAHGLLRAGSMFWAANVAWDTATDVGFYGDSLGGALAVNLAFGFLDLPGNSESKLVRGVAEGIGDNGGEAALRNASRRSPMPSNLLAQGGGTANGGTRRLVHNDCLPGLEEWGSYARRHADEIDEVINNLPTERPGRPFLQYIGKYSQAKHYRGQLGPRGQVLQSHHLIQDAWGDANIPGYISGHGPAVRTPTGVLSDGTRLPHTIINNRQNRRQALRKLFGIPDWAGDANRQMDIAVRDLRAAGYSDAQLRYGVEEIYQFFDNKHIPYTKLPGFGG